MKVCYSNFDYELYTEEEIRGKIEEEVLNNELYLDFLEKMNPREIFSLLTETAKEKIVNDTVNYELFESNEYLWRDF